MAFLCTSAESRLGDFDTDYYFNI